MSEYGIDDENYYDYDEPPEGMVVCDKCNGDGTIDCMCCGDFCCCGVNDELTCPVCLGNEYITKERWEKRAAVHREIMDALWGKPDANGVRTKADSQARDSTEQPHQSKIPTQPQGEGS